MNSCLFSWCRHLGHSSHEFSCEKPNGKRKMGSLTVLFVLCYVAFSQSLVPPSPVTTKLRASLSADSDAIGVSWDWQQVTSDVFTSDQRPIILFDGKCNLCNGGVNFALDHDEKAIFRFVSLQSKVGQSLLIRSGRNPTDITSIVLCLPDGQSFCKSDAILRIAQRLDGPILPLFGFLSLVVPRVLRDVVYRIVSENRYRFGEASDQCRLDLDGEYDTRFVPDP